jgi:N-acetylglucosamine-6-phosphate deacetylase
VWLNGAFFPAVIRIEDGVIAAVEDIEATCDEDYGDSRIVPGFIDVHVHGAYGAMADVSGEEDLIRWTTLLPDEGVTAYLPSTTTEPPPQIMSAIGTITRLMDKGCPGAEILGIHLEGPFVNVEYKGAMKPECIIEPDADLLRSFQAAAGGRILYMTMAVEKDKDFAVLRTAREEGIVVSIGHSSTSYEQAMMGLANGASCFTHAFNAMRPLNHRDPGCAGALMRSDAFTELIFDGLHVDPEVLGILFKIKGGDRIVCISDSLGIKGSPPGVYNMLGWDVKVDDRGVAYLNGTNTLCGSTLMFNKGLRMMVEQVGVPIDWALNSVSLNPARLLGLDHRLGRIKAGYDADMVVLSDNYDVIETYCKGVKSARVGS